CARAPSVWDPPDYW
nr:immunoglobulin heavy chain junction region [Macaca mulatta]MOW98404.1 immunoglobulin heavy chain junction region [Macaca mulatta]MOW99169.1 immunoglobulin heavy chain junction region [Macaca mulatta]MOW99264.1 immunoglobulin heavy chain junction region [Macaca mulatta]MOW99270.1 immunoglobulin heavy chain junction region [Macaca mulatta]